MRRIGRCHGSDGDLLEGHSQKRWFETNFGDVDTRRMAECTAAVAIDFAVVMAVRRDAGTVCCNPLLARRDMGLRVIVVMMRMCNNMVMNGGCCNSMGRLVPMRSHHEPRLDRCERNDEHEKR